MASENQLLSFPQADTDDRLQPLPSSLFGFPSGRPLWANSVEKLDLKHGAKGRCNLQIGFSILWFSF
jgi:hypothetical protein